MFIQFFIFISLKEVIGLKGFRKELGLRTLQRAILPASVLVIGQL